MTKSNRTPNRQLSGAGLPSAHLLVPILACAAGIGLVYMFQQHSSFLTPTRFGMVVAAFLVAVIAIYMPARLTLGMLVPFSVIPLHTAMVGSINSWVILGFTLVYLYKRQLGVLQLIRKNPLNVPIALLLFTSSISLIGQRDLGQNADLVLFEFVVVGSNLALYYMISYEIERRSEFNYLFKFLVACCAAEVLICFLQIGAMSTGRTTLIPGLRIEVGRPVRSGLGFVNSPAGSFHETELLSEFLAMMVPVLVAHVVLFRGRVARIYGAGLLLSSLVLLFTTGARGGIIALGVGALFFGVAALFLRRTSPWRAVGILVMVVVLVSMGYQLQRRFLPKYNYLIDQKMAGTEFEGFVPDSRASVFTHYANRIEERPVTGYGWVELRASYRRGWGDTYPHSLYYYTAYTTGLLGLAALLLLLASAAWTPLRALVRSKRRDTDSVVRLLLLTALVVFITDEYKIEYVRMPNYQNVVWAFLALVVGTRHLSDKPVAAAPGDPPGPANDGRNARGGA